MQFKVTKKAMRPASEKEICFYCLSKIGDYHKEDCVLIQKKIKIRIIAEYEVNYPQFYEAEDVEFSRNEGTWCSSNIIDELKELDKKEGCLCGKIKTLYLRDTSEAFLDEG